VYAAYINIERFLVEIFLAYAMISNVCVEQLDFGECREGEGGGGEEGGRQFCNSETFSDLILFKIISVR